ncbi:MAG TPA: c-type cytochrome, partial [Flavitalea sp.]|nr:c-type cytochrome [Flavitalea sp.]
PIDSFLQPQIQVCNMNSLISLSIVLLSGLMVQACKNEPEQKEIPRQPVDYIKRIPGKDDSIASEVIKKGEVLISYSDCYTCHKKDQKLVGPAFIDIARRYPANKAYIELLAQKVILGSSRSWGYPVMAPHPTTSVEDAKTMVSYILSLEK